MNEMEKTTTISKFITEGEFSQCMTKHDGIVVEVKLQNGEFWSSFFDKNKIVTFIKDHKKIMIATSDTLDITQKDLDSRDHVVESCQRAINVARVALAQCDILKAEIETTKQENNAMWEGLNSQVAELQAENSKLELLNVFYIEGLDKSDIEIKDLKTDNDKLKEFARYVIEKECWAEQDLDGFGIEELAERLGLIVKKTATKEDVDDESDYGVGDSIFVFSETLEADKKMTGVCKKCGCTDLDCSQCVKAQGYPCHWVAENKCSRCFCECGAELITDREKTDHLCGDCTKKADKL